MTISHFSLSGPAMLTSFWNFHSRPLSSQADQVQYPLRLAVSSYLPVPKKLAASFAAADLVMLFISTSTPMVCFFISATWFSVLWLIFVPSVLLCFPFR